MDEDIIDVIVIIAFYLFMFGMMYMSLSKM